MAKTLKIYMLGRFQMYLDGQEIVCGTYKNSKIVQLLQYIICHNGRLVPQEELIEQVLRNEAENPSVVLKNLIYRLRKLFAAHTEQQIIASSRGAYGFLPALKCQIDTELFCALEEQALTPSNTAQVRLHACMQALKLYEGNFLPKSSSELWVMKQAARIESLYVKYLTANYNLSQETSGAELTPYLAQASQLVPYHEQVRYMYIESLHRQHKTADALRQYDAFAALLFDDLCVEPSDQMKELHRSMLGVLHPTALATAADARKNFHEEDQHIGAFYCPQEVFSRLFLYAVRQAERNGQTLMLMLCTLTEKDGTQPQGGERLRETVQNLHEAIGETCRSGDAYTRNSPAQFTILLAGSNNENWKLVAERLRTKFYGIRNMKHMRLLCDCISAIDFEAMHMS